MKFHPLENKKILSNGYKQSFEVGEYKLLLIHHNDRTYLIENKCGHFGYPLDTGEVKDSVIYCIQHNISFNLVDGQIDNRPFENADPIKVFKWEEQEGIIGISL